MVLLLLVFSVSAVDMTDYFSPFTSTVFTWETSETVGLPWYPVEPGFVEMCSRDFSTIVGADTSQVDVVSYSLTHPIYKDTITMTARKKPAHEGYYYEVGWYVQPYNANFSVEVIIENTAGARYKLAEFEAKKTNGNVDYKAFPIPCDPILYGEENCLPITGELSTATLKWQNYVGDVYGPEQYLVHRFVEVTPE